MKRPTLATRLTLLKPAAKCETAATHKRRAVVLAMVNAGELPRDIVNLDGSVRLDVPTFCRAAATFTRRTGKMLRL